MTSAEFEKLISDTAGLLPRSELETEFREAYQPCEGIEQSDLDELVADFTERYPLTTGTLQSLKEQSWQQPKRQ